MLRKRAREETLSSFVSFGGFEKDFVKLVLDRTTSVYSAFAMEQVCRLWHDIVRHHVDFWKRMEKCFGNTILFLKNRFNCFYNFDWCKPHHKRVFFEFFRVPCTLTRHVIYRYVFAFVPGSTPQPATYGIWKIDRFNIKHDAAKSDFQSYGYEVANGTETHIQLFFCNEIGILKRINYGAWEVVSVGDFIGPWVEYINN